MDQMLFLSIEFNSEILKISWKYHKTRILLTYAIKCRIFARLRSKDPWLNTKELVVGSVYVSWNRLHLEKRTLNLENTYLRQFRRKVLTYVHKLRILSMLYIVEIITWDILSTQMSLHKSQSIYGKCIIKGNNKNTVITKTLFKIFFFGISTFFFIYICYFSFKDSEDNFSKKLKRTTDSFRKNFEWKFQILTFPRILWNLKLILSSFFFLE